MKRILLALAIAASSAVFGADFAAPIVTNVPLGKSVMRSEAAAPLSSQRLAERSEEAEAARANVLAASSNTVGLVKSAQRIKAVPGGGRAEFGLLNVFFPADAAGEERFLVTTPGGRELAFQPRFLAWHDTSTGERWLLACVTNRVGFIVPAGEVWYTNAFGPDVRVDLRFRYGRNLLEQDLVVRERLPVPEGALGENLRLESWTEWFDSVPAKRQAQTIDLRRGQGDAAPALASDDEADFLAAKIGGGSAFSTGEPDDKFPVAKTWARVDGRDWLIETVDYRALKAKFDALGGARGKRTAKAGSSKEELIRSLAVRAGNRAPISEPASSLIETAQRAGSETDAPPLLAQADLPETPGVVVDFAILACVPMPPGIISWWPAGGNANDAIDASGNNGTLYNNATLFTGQVGQGFVFNGYTEDYVEIANTPPLNPPNGLTVEAWIHFTSESSGWNMPIVSKDGGNGRQYLLTKTESDALRAHVGIGQTFYYTDGQIVLQPDTWHHVAMTYSAAENELKIYVDGELDVVEQVSGTLLTSTEPLYLGGAPYWGYYWSGGIDEASVYDRALSEAEIGMIYEAGAAGKINPNCVVAPADIAAWFPGDTHPDSVSSGHTATLLNGAGYAPAVASHGFKFDGVNDAVTVDHDQTGNLDIGAGQDFSLEVWLKADQITNPYGVMSVIGKRYSPNSWTALGWELFLINGQPGLQLADSSGPANYIIPSVDLRNTGWRHVVVTVDRDSSTGVRFFVDGIQVVQFNPTGKAGSLSNNNPLRIGVHPQSGLNCFYKGIIDEATVYRRALSGTEVSSLYQAGSAGKCKTDMDNDVLADWWEMRHFGNLDRTGAADYDADGLTDLLEYQSGTNPTLADTDSDGLTDLEEVTLPVDANDLSKGMLDPLDADTGDTGLADGQKDADHDGLSNLSELRKYPTSPTNLATFGKYDPIYLFVSPRGDTTHLVKWNIVHLDSGRYKGVITSAPDDAAYDLYYLPAFDYTSKWRRISSVEPGQRSFIFTPPPGPEGYFMLLDAADDEGDGLSNGYEARIWHDGLLTSVSQPDSDADGMRDGWEESYGLDPTRYDATGNPDGDGYNNFQEYDQNRLFAAPSYDPLKPYASTVQPPRPVVSISTSDSQADELGGSATFTIQRSVGLGADMASQLKVYYSVGGSAEYLVVGLTRLDGHLGGDALELKRT